MDAAVPDDAHGLVSSAPEAGDSKGDADAGSDEGCEPGTLELMKGYRIDGGCGRKGVSPVRLRQLDKLWRRRQEEDRWDCLKTEGGVSVSRLVTDCHLKVPQSFRARNEGEVCMASYAWRQRQTPRRT